MACARYHAVIRLHVLACNLAACHDFVTCQELACLQELRHVTAPFHVYSMWQQVSILLQLRQEQIIQAKIYIWAHRPLCDVCMCRRASTAVAGGGVKPTSSS